MIGGPPQGAGRHGTLLPPARSRQPAARVPDAGLPLLPPVVSGLFGPYAPAPGSQVRPASFAAEPPEAIHDSFASVTEPVTAPAPVDLPLIADPGVDPASELEAPAGWFGDEPAPWEQSDTPASEEIVLEIEDEPADLLLDTVEVDEVIETASAADDAPPDARPTPAPISPWDLGAASAGTEAEERAARARAEWESLGQALTGSLSVDSPATQPRGAHEIELTDEIVASLEAQMGESYSPFTSLHSYSPLEQPAGKRAALSDLARRLEAFAAQIRAEGPEALARAQREGDRVDALLAGIAAGFIAGRGE